MLKPGPRHDDGTTGLQDVFHLIGKEAFHCVPDLLRLTGHASGGCQHFDFFGEPTRQTFPFLL